MQSPQPADKPGLAASAGLGGNPVSFDEIDDGIYAYIADGCSNTGVVVGDDSVLVFDAQATPKMAQAVIDRVRSVTDKPIHHLVLSHYHAVRALGAPAYGARQIVCSDEARDLILERGEQERANEIARHPHLFRGAETILPDLTWPTTTFSEDCSIWLGRREVRLIRLGRGHTTGDIIALIPDCSISFVGDLVEHGAAPYCGDAHFEDWPATLDDLSQIGSVAMLPGRGAALIGPSAVSDAIAATRAFLRDLYEAVGAKAEGVHSFRETFEHVHATLKPAYGDLADFDRYLPFSVSRAYDEVGGLDRPRIWTDERDRQMWAQLRG
ncbi:MBL fold metallo-hydrolase [Bosea sp. PAMC 26642]|uniref:MBL fold metallo-hydrolase n=1 Tax=Bosea sp. (strain PAMC 26642) TaxID=1792307 RepID=UPI00076FF5B6|nr:MBL fold metallo-hydrolase [Bosea sp. PAMC 26642]AMJ59335.1 MBL fold metallo-hydrolase [Bosea sp. PAMC 26642]